MSLINCTWPRYPKSLILVISDSGKKFLFICFESRYTFNFCSVTRLALASQKIQYSVS